MYVELFQFNANFGLVFPKRTEYTPDFRGIIYTLESPDRPGYRFSSIFE